MILLAAADTSTQSANKPIARTLIRLCRAHLEVDGKAGRGPDSVLCRRFAALIGVWWVYGGKQPTCFGEDTDNRHRLPNGLERSAMGPIGGLVSTALVWATHHRHYVLAVIAFVAVLHCFLGWESSTTLPCTVGATSRFFESCQEAKNHRGIVAIGAGR